MYYFAAVSRDLLLTVLSLGVKSPGLATTNHILSGCLPCTRLLNTRILQFSVLCFQILVSFHLLIFSFILKIIVCVYQVPGMGMLQ